ncbi:NUDIX domain-containing protein [Nocardioides sp. CFH 31398]|nr:NUDIX domain-containing protein [Nocardioides sp. CFH 31398]
MLAARRTHPPAAAGRWELPGGKVEAGETPDAALVREVAEELGCTVAVRRWLDEEVPIAAAAGPGLVLRVAVCDLVAGEPDPVEHDRLAWLGPEGLDDVDWLEPDRPFLPALRAHLGG